MRNRTRATKTKKTEKDTNTFPNLPLTDRISHVTQKPVLSPEEQKKLNDQLMEAAGMGRIEEVRKLVGLGANVNAKSWSGYNALFWAARWGRSEMCKVLCELGADVNAKNYGCWTALMQAAYRGWPKTCKVLCWKLMANPFLKNTEGKTAYDLIENMYIEDIKKIRIKHIIKAFENLWKRLGKEQTHILIQNTNTAIRECNPEKVREIIVGL